MDPGSRIGDKVVQMNIDGVDASVSGITECPVPPGWAEIAVGEAGADGDDGEDGDGWENWGVER